MDVLPTLEDKEKEVRSEFQINKLTPEDRFPFTCHSGLSCFTECCHNIDIVLTPFDALRIKRKLGISSDEFLSKYIRFSSIKGTEVPMIIMKMNDDEKAACPFVSEEGCAVYDVRPTVCRYYPVGFATFNEQSASEPGGTVFLMKEKMCKGHEEKKTWAAHEWLDDQGLEQYKFMNEPWLEIVTRLKGVKPKENTDKKMQTFVMASYDLDTFRKFVFGSSFLDRFEVDKETAEKIREDDIELLKFGFQWLLYALFAEGPIAPKSA